MKKIHKQLKDKDKKVSFRDKIINILRPRCNDIFLKCLAKIRINCILALSVMLLGVIGVLGWIFDIQFLKSVSNDWVTLKPTSTILLILSGFLLLFTENVWFVSENIRKMITSFCSFTIFFIIFWLTFNVLHHNIMGFTSSYKPELYTTFPLFPSIASIFGFFLIGVRGLAFLFSTNKVRYIQTTGSILLIMAISALIGYIFNKPLLFFYIENKSSAMAFFTALGFLLSGLVFINRKKSIHH